MTTLGEYAHRLEQAVFVGRHRQLDWFAGWLRGGHPDVALLNVVGHGGTGKTALLRRFTQVADEQDVPYRLLDGATLEPGLGGLVDALGARDVDEAVGAIDALGGVLLLDGIEEVPGLARPFVDELLPRLAVPVRVVVASRRELLPRTGSHPLRRAAHRLDLHHFDRRQVRAYLDQRGLGGDDVVAQVWDVARGNPLATSMAADVLARAGARRLDLSSEWRRALPGLIERLLSDLDGDLRELVEAAAFVRQFDEELLPALVCRRVPTDELEDLARLAMVRAAERGLRLHDDVRTIVAHDLRRRRPDHVTTLRSRALHAYQRRMASAGPREREWLVSERLFLWEHDVVRTSLFPSSGLDDELVVESAGRDDEAAVVELWRRHGDTAHPVQGGAPTDDVSVDEIAALIGRPNVRMMVARGTGGEVLGAGLELRIAEDTLGSLPRVARLAVEACVAAGHGELPPYASGSDVRYLGPVVADPEAPVAMGRLARWAIGSWINGGVIIVGTTMPGYAGLLEALGFSRVPLEVEVEGRPVHAIVLDVDAGDPEDWIRRVTAMSPPERSDEGGTGTVTVQVLDGFRVTRDGQDATPSGLAAQAVKHVVVAGGALHVEELAERLWPEAGDSGAGRNRLRNVLARLRDSSGELLVRDGDTLRLAEGVEVDADEVARAVRLAPTLVREQPGEARLLLDWALQRWRGELLPGDVYVDAFAGVRERLRRLRISAYDLLATAALAEGDHDGAVAALEHAIDLDPYDEDRYLRIARLLVGAGRRGAARQVLRRARQADDRLGVTPSPALEELEEELRV